MRQIGGEEGHRGGREVGTGRGSGSGSGIGRGSGMCGVLCAVAPQDILRILTHATEMATRTG